MAELQSWELEHLRRSIVMAAPGQPFPMNRELALDIIEQLMRAIKRIAELENQP